MAKEEQGVHQHAAETESIEVFFAQVGLTPEEIAQVKLQGFVSREQRGTNTTVFKLRYRLDGRQRTKYLGTDVDRAIIIEQQLKKLQSARELNKKLRALNRKAAQLLRKIKPRLEPLVAQMGLRFHGRVLRRSRTIAVGGNTKSD